LCENFAIRAESEITFADTMIHGGDVGVSFGTVMSGLKSIFDGDVVITDAATFTASAIQALGEAMAIRVDAVPILIPEIGEFTFTPGTRHAGTITIAAGKTVTLDGQGNPNSQFLIQADTTMNVGAGCNIVLINEAKAENVVWAVGTLFTASAGTDFKGSIMAGTSVTFDAEIVLEGSIMAQTAVTLGPKNQVYGCIIALSAITFGTENYVAGVQAEDPAAARTFLIEDFPLLANDNDEFIIACMPLTDAAPAECDDLPIHDDMEEMLNNCTQQGIYNAVGETRRRASRSDIPQFEGDIVIAPIATLDEGGGRTRTFRGAGQKGRRLEYNMCNAIDPPLNTVIYCCMNGGEHTYCGTPSCETTSCRRRELQGNATDVKQYLPSISQECSSQFQALQQVYLDSDPGALCFVADENNVLDLRCHAILVTGGG
jgi:hypothetical protein